MSDQQNDPPNFDISGLLGGAFNMMQGVKGVADNGRKTVAGFFDRAVDITKTITAKTG